MALRPFCRVSWTGPPAACGRIDRYTAREGGRGEQCGVFAGLWREPDGRLRGHLRGGYGVDGDGARILVGKVIGPRGRFRGLICGAWQPGAADDLPGGFTGRWAVAGGPTVGVLGRQAFAVAG